MFSLAVIVASICLAIPAIGSAQAPRATPLAGRAPVLTSVAIASLPNGPVVALGDSYTAGALLPIDLTASPPGCLRSTKAYPALVATALGVPLTDAACASAGVKNLALPQPTYPHLGTNQPQLDALAPDDRLVMLSLGGDDIGFSNVLDECMKLSFTDPWGSPCAAHYTSGGTDQLAALITAEGRKMTAGLAAIAARP